MSTPHPECPACVRTYEIGLRPGMCSIHFDAYSLEQQLTAWIDTAKEQPKDGETVATLNGMTVRGEFQYVYSM